MSSTEFPPLQLKGEIMDLDFTVDTDHRKRRRNRTTQSCLNCHTSKRKCDRKRPCQRCIQLGLTGLCVYEIDDPALRYVCKPHPRWADASAGDPSDRWHSRAAKNNIQLRRARASTGILPADNNHGINGQQVKPEPLTGEISQPHLYRFTPSPPAPTAYNGMGFSPSSSSGLYHSHPSHQQHGSSYDNGLWYDADTHHQQRQQSHHHHTSHSHHHHQQQQQFCCSCRTSPALVSLGHHLQNALAALGHHHPQSSHQRHPGQHADPDGSGCLLFKRLSELSGAVHWRFSSLADSSSCLMPSAGTGSSIAPNSSSGARGSTSGAGSPYGSPPYGTLPTPTDSEIHSPACGTPFHVSGSVSGSGSSSPSSPSSGSSSVGVNGGQQNPGPSMSVEWGNYNSYFPLQVSSGMSGVNVNMGVGVGVGIGVGVGGDGGGMYGGIIAS
ncbi:hypothetical protein EDC04DRAFT_2640703 [Pisolithus marmoratus]|nr:hypothetical protein EDC04DRAFT_2640703 [Pisolithus marmoratus]